MTVIEMKEKLIARINEIDDERKLHEIEDIIDFQENLKIRIPTPEQALAIKEALDQVSRGEYMEEEEANRQIEEWLKK